MHRIMLVGDTPLLKRCFDLLEPLDYLEVVYEMYPFREGEFLDAVMEFKPNIVLYDVTAGSSSQPNAQPERSFRVNSAGAARTALICRMNDAKMWMMSDASVFPGQGDTTVDTEPFPIHAFGLSRLLGERSVHALAPSSTIVRTGWLYGEEMPECPPMIAEDTVRGERSMANVQQGILGSPTYLEDAARTLTSNLLISLLMGIDWGPIVHLAPRRVTDWYGLLADEYPKVEPTSIKASREIYMGVRNASLTPTEGWEIEEGGLDRFIRSARGYTG